MTEYEKLQQGNEVPKSGGTLWPGDNEVAFNIVLEKSILRKRSAETLENGERRLSAKDRLT